MKRTYVLMAVALIAALVLITEGADGGQNSQGGDRLRDWPETSISATGGNATASVNCTSINGNKSCSTYSSQGQGQGQGQGQWQGKENATRGPRADDDRPRNWGSANSRGETEFDDRKSPRKVAFLGKSANIRIYPNYSQPTVYIQLRFGKVQEVDALGRPVPRHAIESLADAAAVSYTSGNMTVNGVNISYVNLSVSPVDRQSFTSRCLPPGSEDGEDGEASRPPPPPPLPPSSGPSPAGRRALLAHSRALLANSTVTLPPPPQLNLSLLFGLDASLTFKYGSANVTVPANGLKWTVSYQNWPFCNNSNTLMMSLSLLLANDASAQVPNDTAANGTTQLRIVLGSSYNATLTFLDYALTGLQDDAARMPVNVSTRAEGGVTTVHMALPNPATVNATSVWYDPTQTTTSAYLSSTDPGNTATATVTSTATMENGSGEGSAGALRTTLWTAVGALMLSALLAGAQQ